MLTLRGVEMAKLEDRLIKKNYSVEKIGGRMIATPTRGGLYRATSARDVELALTNGTQQENVLIRRTTKSKWTPLPRQ